MVLFQLTMCLCGKGECHWCCPPLSYKCIWWKFLKDASIQKYSQKHKKWKWSKLLLNYWMVRKWRKCAILHKNIISQNDEYRHHRSGSHNLGGRNRSHRSWCCQREASEIGNSWTGIRTRGSRSQGESNAELQLMCLEFWGSNPIILNLKGLNNSVNIWIW